VLGIPVHSKHNETLKHTLPKKDVEIVKKSHH